MKPTARWFDKDGAEVDNPLDAVYAEITQTLSDGRESRTYMAPAFDPASPGSSIMPETGDQLGLTPWEGADSTKGTWDIRMPSHAVATTLDELIIALRLDEASVEVQKEEVALLMVLPAWVPAPVRLKAEVELWMAAP
jgi:hypothetical protein